MAPTPGLLLQMLEQTDRKHEEGHQRLRASCREYEGWLHRLEKAIAQQAAEVAAIRSTPPEVARLRFSPAIVLVIVTTALSIAGGMWASTYSLRSDVRDLLTQQAAATKLQDERAATMREEVATLKRENQLWKYDMQAQLKEISEKLRQTPLR